ncbi:MAG: hypothetical protein IJI85_10190 [Clostridia bacterium]|nr:hypothetical protein [Lentisphaeria bacterium]MBR0422929.1 hypothetical protein [Clostridia bacterium]
MSEKERFFSFLERWETYARELPAEELRRLILAACGYAFRNEEPPADLPLAARMALVDMRARIDWEAHVHAAKVAAGAAGAKVSNSRQAVSRSQQKSAEVSKESAEDSTLKGKGMVQGREEKKTPIYDRGKRKEKGAFLCWSNEDFRFAAEEVCATHPEYRPYLDAFVGYWTEEHRDGGPRFRKMEAFSMASRLATWKRLQEQRAPQWPMMPPAPRTAQEALDLIPEANS